MRKQMIIAATLGLLPTLALAAEEIREGRWQYTSTMQVEGMPQMQNMPKMPEGMQLPPGVKMPSMGPKGMTSTFESCVTKDNPVPRDAERERQCKTTKMERHGNKVNWAATCDLRNGDTAESEGEGVYTNDSSQMTIKTRATHQGRPINSTMQITGKYLGPCDKK